MSISLNITQGQGATGHQKRNTNVKKNVPHFGNNGFSFEFTKKKNIKATVVRQRAVPKVTTKPSPSQHEKVKSHNPFSVPPKKSFMMVPQHSYNSDDSDTKQDSGVELSLNICRVPVAKQERKKKPNREERQNAKRNFRKEQANRVLTKQEIDDGIKKFSALPGRSSNVPKRKGKKQDLFKDNPETKMIGQRLVKPITETIFTGASTDSVGLHPHCIKNLADIMNITQLTTVQLRTIPKALDGRDVLVRSQTGSGKTLAYALPVVQKLQEIRPKLTRDGGIRAVVIVPTRELAIQTYEIFVKLLKPYTWVVAGYLTGGEKRKSEKARLRKGITILIGTPGRMVDHLLHTATLKFDKTQFLVLDEGDRLLEMGYERDVRKIVEGINDHKAGKFTTVPDTKTSDSNEGDKKIDTRLDDSSVSKLQTMLLSATMTSAVQRLAGLTLKDPLFIDTSDAEVPMVVTSGDQFSAAVQDAVDDGKLSIPSTVQLSFVVVPPKLRLVTLSGILAKTAAKGNLKALVFMSTMEMVDFHHSLLMECLTENVLDDEDEKRESDSEDGEEPLLKGVTIFRLHGTMSQTERIGVFNAFRSCKSGILLTTDVAGRGIDIIEVNLVIQYSPPQNIAEFVHRVGRTARAGRSGQAILFVGPNEVEFIRRLEDKRIRISQDEGETYLKVLKDSDSSAHTLQEAASNLQHKFELLIEVDEEIHEKARKAFVSWVRFYSTFPKDLKSIFNIKNAHMGHFAKSFGLREPPKSFVRNHSAPKPALPTNRLTYTERDPEKIKQEKKLHRKRSSSEATGRKVNQQLSNKFQSKVNTSFALTISEYDSGILPKKKRKKN